MFASETRVAQRQRQTHTEPLHACAGVMCERHQRCARYVFVEGTLEPSTYWLGTCAPFGSKHPPGFIDVEFIGPPDLHQYTLTRYDLHPKRRGTS